MKKTKKTVKSKDSAATTDVILLLDRTGSMSSCKEETIRGFNGYLDELIKKPDSKSMRFTVVQFDSQSLDSLCERVPIHQVPRLNDQTFVPRAMTPLYEAIGKTIRSSESKTNGGKVLFVILTDGLENASSEWTFEGVRKAIKDKEDNAHWTFSYIGVKPESWAQGDAMFAGTKSFSNVMKATDKNAGKVYGMMASATMSVGRSAGGQCIGSLYGGKHLDKDDE